MQSSKWSFIRLTLIILAVNIALTAWTVYVKPVLNYDAILYITAAKAISNGDWQLATELYQGSLYPFLIQLLSSISGLSFENAAHGLNSLFLTIICLAFISTVRLLGGSSKSVLIISSIVIVFFPSLLKFRPFIIRDFAYLSCYLWSIYFLLAYYQSNKTFHLASWAALLCLGACFRIESVIFLVFIGFLLTLSYAFKRVRKGHYAPITGISIVAILMLGALLYLPTLMIDVMGLNSLVMSLSYPTEYINKAISQLSEKLAISSNESGGTLVAILKPFGNVVYETLKRLEVIYAILAFIAFKMRLTLSQSYQRRIIACYIGINIIVLSLFEVSLSYLTSRYTLALALTILLLAPFTLEKAIENFSERKTATKFALSLLIIALCFVSLKRLEVSERHIEATAGKWIKTNLNDNQIIISNNSKILYYANQNPYFCFKKCNHHYKFSTRFLLHKQNKGSFEQANYLVFLVNKKDPIDIQKENEFKRQFGEPIKRFVQNEKLYVHVYKLK